MQKLGRRAAFIKNDSPVQVCERRHTLLEVRFRLARPKSLFRYSFFEIPTGVITINTTRTFNSYESFVDLGKTMSHEAVHQNQDPETWKRESWKELTYQGNACEREVYLGGKFSADFKETERRIATLDKLHQLDQYFLDIEALGRREVRNCWRAWSQTFCSGGKASWDTIGSGEEVVGATAIHRYSEAKEKHLTFGWPDAGEFYQVTLGEFPPYDAWEELYHSRPTDALYVWSTDLNWTLAIHHEQFGGLSRGPIFAFAKR
jgi:hypothetical protein